LQGAHLLGHHLTDRTLLVLFCLINNLLNDPFRKRCRLIYLFLKNIL
jgi:hypothetical protein